MCVFPKAHQPDGRDRALSFPRPALHHLSLGRRRRAASRSTSTTATTIRRSSAPRARRSVRAGQGVQWECYWENNTDNDFKFGPFTDTNEHCNWFGFYYPTDTQDESITCVTKDNQLTMTVRAGG